MRPLIMLERIRTGLAIAALRSGSIAAKFGITLFIATFFDLPTLGVYGLLVGAAVVVPVIAGLGIIEALSRASVSQELSEVTEAFVPYWAFLATLYAVVTVACLPWAFFHDQVAFVLLVGTLLFVEHLNSDVLTVLNHRQRPLLANVLLAVRTILWIGCYIAIAFWFPAMRNLSTVISFWLFGAVTALMCFGWACRDWPWHFSFDPLRTIMRLRSVVSSSRILYINELVNTSSQYLDRYIVSSFLGLELAGVYFLFWSIANALSNLLNTSLLQVQQPFIILARQDLPRQGRMLGELRLECALASIGLGLLTAVLVFLALAHFPRPGFSSHISVLFVLLAGFVLRMMYEVEGIAFYSRHEDNNTLLSGALVLFLSLLITLSLTNALNLLGPALAVVVSYFGGWFWRWRRNSFVYSVRLVPPAFETGRATLSAEDRSIKPTDVALFMPTLTGGGAERIQLVLAEYFLSQGLQVDVVVCKRVGALCDSVPAGVRLVNLDGKRVLLSLRRYERYLRMARPRVVISSVENASMIACLGRARDVHRHRLIVRQDNALVATLTLAGEPRRWVWLLVLRFALRFADHVIAVSQGVEGQVRHLLGSRGPPVSCVYNPVITCDFESRLRADSDTLWTTSAAPLIVAAGRLHPVKDYPTLLRAFALVRRRTMASLIIMGEGDARAELEALAAELGIATAVRFAGFVRNPLPVIRRADVFVLSSSSEGFPSVLVEALAVETPVVSTDCRHGPLEILGHGQYGRLVPVADAGALASAIGETLAAPRPSPREGLQDHLSRYSIEHVGKTYMSLLSE